MPAPRDDTRPSTLAEALDGAAAALRGRRFAEAERLAGYVLKSNPAHADAAQILGQALLQQGRPAEVVAPLKRAARRNADPVIETLLARALAELGRETEAVDVLQTAVTRRPAYPMAFLELGDRLRQAHRLDEALATFEDGLALAPEALVLRVGLGHVQLARNDRIAARRLFMDVRAAAPERLDAMVGLAGVLALDGAYAEAAELYRLALQRRPQDLEMQVAYAKCRLELGDRTGGEAVLGQVARVDDPRAAAMAITALAGSPRGRLFLRPSAARRYLEARGG